MGGKRKKSRKKMPTNVVNYFKLLGQGHAKAEARKLAGLPKAQHRRKSWGPGNALYDWKLGKK